MVSQQSTTSTIDSVIESLYSPIMPRSYQTELMSQAKEENLIVCLPTGSGKTYIAIMLIKEMSAQTRRSIHEGGKRTAFLVQTVTLVQQQSEYLATHTDLKIGQYHGELNVDFWDKEKWINEFENHQVLVFTAQVFLNLVNHNHFPLHKVNLLIFDECHHCSGNSPYVLLMNNHYDKCFEKPRILGLTASISGKKINADKLATAAKEVERVFRARLASGSNREESSQHGTSAQFESIFCPVYEDEICRTNESITIPFDILKSISNDIGPYLVQKKLERQQLEEELVELMLNSAYLEENVTNYTTSSNSYMIFLQSQYISLPRLKQYLGDLEHVGKELGLYGLYIATKNLRRVLKLSNSLELIADPVGQFLYHDAVARLDCLMEDIIEPLIQIHHNDLNILFSSKVLKLYTRIKRDFDNNHRCLCIVFVQRVHTAAVLSTVLTHLNERLPINNQNQLKIKYVTGAKGSLGETTMMSKRQNKVIKEFRQGEINVLVATAVVEEGLDIPKCNLVFRFNKPPNFASYMQSKGRARAKQNASYVLLIDQTSSDSGYKDLTEYENYEKLERMIQNQFSIDDDDNFTADGMRQLEPYRTENGVVIDAIRAAQLIHQYCAYLGHGALCPPRILYRELSERRFVCALSMPANCPVREDIICENASKRLAKSECCLKMIKLLHQRNELDENCLPYPRRSLIDKSPTNEMKLFRLCDQLFEKKDDSTKENIPKQILSIPESTIIPSNSWYLYRINIRSEKDKLGFLVPVKLPELPNFELYTGTDQKLTVDVTLIQEVDYTPYRTILERFCQYLFEHVIKDIVDTSESSLTFNLTKSPFKLLPCLLKNMSDIDVQRMLSICSRLNKPVENHSHLSTDELYITSHTSIRHFFTVHQDNSVCKRTSDLWQHSSSFEEMKTYADHFQSVAPNVLIHRDAPMAVLKGVSHRRINYLNQKSLSKKDKKTQTIDPQIFYFPIELLNYAPVNHADLNLFYKWPSLLVRICQMYWCEKLRSTFMENISKSPLPNIQVMRRVVKFDDFFTTVDLSKGTATFSTSRSFLPLTRLTYESIDEVSVQHPSLDLIFQSLTCQSCAEEMNHENLEILGDCFLKLITSMSLYYRYGSAGAGFLSTEKIKQISNENLYRLAVLKGLKNYLYAERIEFRGKNRNWLPPGYTSNSNERFTHQKPKRKAISDMIEAFIGAYLVSSDYATTIRWMKWLGLDVIPLDQQHRLCELPSIHRVQHNQIDEVIEKFLRDQGLIEIETIINYSFRNKAYLIAAFTHPSNFSNRITDCYERLEFLGDAILDFLLTRYIFIHQKEKLTPGRVTDIRVDLSNNSRLAYIAVSLGLHRKILHNSPALFGLIGSYAGDETLFPKNQTTEEYLKRDLDQWAADHAPKALADVFEALVGAIFLDSGNSLDIVWNTIEPFLRSYMDRSMSNPNLNPIRSFLETGGKVINESNEPISDRLVSICRVQRADGRIFEGHGKNKSLAKTDACRKALESD